MGTTTHRAGIPKNRAAIFLPLLMLNIYFLSSTESALFSRLPGYHVTSPITSTVPCSDTQCSLSLCAVYCQHQDCVSLSFHATQQICHLHDKPIYSQEVTYEASPEWEYMQIKTDFVMYDDWILIFRATRHINQSAYDTWVNPGRPDDHPILRHDVPVGCLTLNGSNPCDRHFKSTIIDMWDTYSIDQVKMVLYDNGVPMESITFNGTGTSSTSWFNQYGMISSTWSDIIGGTFNFFAAEGQDWTFRRWYISNLHNGCENDLGWMMVLDTIKVVCEWEDGVSFTYPVFIYAPNHQKTKWTTREFKQADVMAVFVKISP